MEDRLSGSRLAVVTGGAGGLGAAIAARLGREGWAILVADLNARGVAEVAERLEKSNYKVAFSVVDITDPTAVQQLAADAAALGGASLLVNNAGVMGAPGWQSSSTSRPEDWDVAMAVNVKGVHMCAAALSHQLVENAGRIVNIASIAGRVASANYPHYHASKAAVISLTQSLAMALAPSGVNVNAVSPALVWTNMTAETYEWLRLYAGVPGSTARDAFLAKVEQRTLLGREVEPDDIAAAVMFLASDSARNITGQTLNVDSGAVMT